MKRSMLLLTISGLLTLSGCGLFNSVLPSTVVIRLVNNGTFPVDVQVYTSDNVITTETLLKTLGTMQEFTIQAGQSRTLTEDCDDVKAIACEAQLQAVVIEPDDETGVLRDETNFECRNTITFTFEHTIVLVDFNIVESVDN